MAIKHTPAKIACSQNIQRQDTPATFIKPDTVGPNDGPANGASVKMANAFPRVSASQISEMTALQQNRS